MTDERVLRRIAAAYFALITFLDENIAEVMRVAEELGLLATTRIIYTSDHGELFGAQGLLGKSSLYEGSVGVPLILSGPDIPENHVVSTLVSHVDLFPTVVDGVGGQMARADVDLPGQSLFKIRSDISQLLGRLRSLRNFSLSEWRLRAPCAWCEPLQAQFIRG
jgi:choline-sulfatase